MLVTADCSLFCAAGAKHCQEAENVGGQAKSSMDCSGGAAVLPCTCQDTRGCVMANRSSCTTLETDNLASDRKSRLMGSCKDDKILPLLWVDYSFEWISLKTMWCSAFTSSCCVLWLGWGWTLLNHLTLLSVLVSLREECKFWQLLFHHSACLNDKWPF